MFFFIFNRYDKRFLFKDQTLSMYDEGRGGEGGRRGGRGEGVKGYLVGFLKGKEGRISCRRQKMKETIESWLPIHCQQGRVIRML